MIAKETGGTLFQIEAVKSYPNEYKACVDRAKAEKESKARPEIKGDPTSGMRHPKNFFKSNNGLM